MRTGCWGRSRGFWEQAHGAGQGEEHRLMRHLGRQTQGKELTSRSSHPPHRSAFTGTLNEELGFLPPSRMGEPSCFQHPEVLHRWEVSPSRVE